MNAVAGNRFTRALNDLGKNLAAPKAVLVISAHWQTDGTRILRADPPKTIYDFYGFPRELYRIQYPAPGALEVSDQLARLIKNATLTDAWGLDHGAWSILLHMYPDANVPVLQMSMDRGLDLKGHMDRARELRALREEGVLILGSGNITHNLRAIDYDTDAPPRDWAVEFDVLIKKALLERDYTQLLAKDPSKQALWKQVLPTLEHYLPLLYVLGASFDNEVPTFPIEMFQNGSLSMRSVQFGGVA
jgi:4,5-DOPA dioxygenase extradiol